MKSFLPVFCVSALSCPGLSSPSNGNVALSSGNLVGSTATYSCNSGYKTTFTSTRYCQADGQWSGGEASCIRKSSPFFFILIHVPKINAQEALTLFPLLIDFFVSFFLIECMKIGYFLCAVRNNKTPATVFETNISSIVGM